MDRRSLLKHGATGLAGLGTGYALLDASTTETAAAVSMGELNIADAATTTKDGQISQVKVDVQGSWQYDLPGGKNPHRWKVSLLVTNGETTAELASTHGNAKYLAFEGDWSVSGTITDTNAYNPEDFAAPEGKIKKVTMGFVVVFEVVNPDGKVLAKATIEDTATAEITNKAYQPTNYGNAAGDGEIIIVE